MYLYIYYVVISVKSVFVRTTKSTLELRSSHYGDLYSSPNIVRMIKSRRMRWAGHVACMGIRKGIYKDWVGRPEGKRPLGRPRPRWDNNIKMNLKEVKWVAWVGLIRLRIGTCGGHL